MKAKHVMHKDPMCASPEMSLRDVAQMMVDCNCGAIPVVRNEEVIGIITDRDIVCRGVAQGKSMAQTAAQECMSTLIVSVDPEASLEECFEIMERDQIRRLLVTEGTHCVGIVTQAQVARHVGLRQAGEFLKEVSERTATPSNVGIGR